MTQAAGYRVLPHPADIGLAFWAPSLEGALEQAAQGLALLLGARSASPAPCQPIRFAITGRDEVELLFDFLSHLIYYFDAEHLALSRFRFRPASGGFEVEAAGEVFQPDSKSRGYDVKAVTYHQMALAAEGGAWHGRAYFDI